MFPLASFNAFEAGTSPVPSDSLERNKEIPVAVLARIPDPDTRRVSRLRGRVSEYGIGDGIYQAAIEVILAPCGRCTGVE
jgi:hypothetical protein